MGGIDNYIDLGSVLRLISSRHDLSVRSRDKALSFVKSAEADCSSQFVNGLMGRCAQFWIVFLEYDVVA